MHIFADYEALSQAAARHILQVGRQCIQERRRFNLVLAGGGTPRRTYEILAGTAEGYPVVWDNTHFWWGDERCVPPDHPDSNYRMAKQFLLEPLAIPPAQVHRITAEASDPESVASAYDACFPRRADLLILGCGEDGHTASLFPGSSALGEFKRRFVAVEAPKQPKCRITVTPLAIVAARSALLLAAHSDKASALLCVFTEQGCIGTTPARLVRNATWFVDKDAAVDAIRSNVSLSKIVVTEEAPDGRG